jgi:hypothetical protein
MGAHHPRLLMAPQRRKGMGPGREWVDRKTGEIHYANLIDLDRPVLDRFRVAALQAVHAIVERGAP